MGTQPKVLDAQWFRELQEIAVPTVSRSYTFLNNFSRDEFERFIAGGKKSNPEIKYAFLRKNTIDTAREQLEALRTEIVQREQEKSICTVYQDKIEELLTGLDLLHATLSGDYDRYERANRQLFGEWFNSRFFISNIMSRMPLAHNDSGAVWEVPAHTFCVVSEAMNQCIPRCAVQADILNSNALVRCWSDALPEYAASWKVVVNDRATALATRNKSKMVIVPAGLNYRRQNVQKLFAHEIGVHVQRYERGLQTPIHLLSMGLAGYQKAEEGIALIAEQTLTGDKRLQGIDKYFAVSAARGLLDGQAKDFKDLYSFLEPHFVYRFERKKISNPQYKAAAYTWRLCLRTFRGGFTDLPGGCFWKGKMYLEGNHRLWQHFIQAPESVASIVTGKFDPTNQCHVDLINRFCNPTS